MPNGRKWRNAESNHFEFNQLPNVKWPKIYNCQIFRHYTYSKLYISQKRSFGNWIFGHSTFGNWLNWKWFDSVFRNLFAYGNFYISQVLRFGKFLKRDKKFAKSKNLRNRVNPSQQSFSSSKTACWSRSCFLALELDWLDLDFDIE